MRSSGGGTGPGGTAGSPAGPDTGSGWTDLERALADLVEPAPDDFALRILRRVGIPEERYDTYLLLDAPGGGLYVAYGPTAVTHAVLSTGLDVPAQFEERHRARTGRAAIRAVQPPPGVRAAIRTGRARHLAIDLDGLPAVTRAVLDAVRAVPRGQLRPLTWVAREAGLTDPGPVLDALAANPVQLLIPCHRIAHDDGTPCDAAYGTADGELLRDAEGMDLHRVERLVRDETIFLGSDTTRIFCHPTCAHARRITPPHQVPFRSARDARHAGYRPCKSCRPVAA